MINPNAAWKPGIDKLRAIVFERQEAFPLRRQNVPLSSPSLSPHPQFPSSHLSLHLSASTFFVAKIWSSGGSSQGGVMVNGWKVNSEPDVATSPRSVAVTSSSGSFLQPPPRPPCTPLLLPHHPSPHHHLRPLLVFWSFSDRKSVV